MKYTGVSPQIYALYQQLERLEDVLNFTVFYSFAESLQSHHFCPGFEFEGGYYEIQKKDNDELNLLLFFGQEGRGYVRDSKEIEGLVERLNKVKL